LLTRHARDQPSLFARALISGSVTVPLVARVSIPFVSRVGPPFLQARPLLAFAF
jgi:hypothetical protein